MHMADEDGIAGTTMSIQGREGLLSISLVLRSLDCMVDQRISVDLKCSEL